MGFSVDTRVALREVAANQLGVFTLSQAVAAGVTRRQLATDLRHQAIERVYAEVLAFTGVAWTPERRYLAAALAGGARSRTTHRPAAWLWQLTQFEQKPEISIPTERSVQLRGVRVHRSSDLPDEIEVRHGVPTTDVNRVLVDLGAVFRVGRVRDAVDRAIARKYTTPMRILAELNELAQRGRRGVGVMRALLDEAGLTGSHAPSVLEAKMRRLIKQAGLPQPACEFIAGENGEYRLDFCWPEVMLVVEVSGWQYHSSFDAFCRGMTRQNRLTLHGYAYLEYSWMHVTKASPQIVDELRRAYRQSRIVRST